MHTPFPFQFGRVINIRISKLVFWGKFEQTIETFLKNHAKSCYIQEAKYRLVTFKGIIDIIYTK